MTVKKSEVLSFKDEYQSSIFSIRQCEWNLMTLASRSHRGNKSRVIVFRIAPAARRNRRRLVFFPSAPIAVRFMRLRESFRESDDTEKRRTRTEEEEAT